MQWEFPDSKNYTTNFDYMCKVFEKYGWNIHKKAIPILTGLVTRRVVKPCRHRQAAAGLLQQRIPLAPSLEFVNAVIKLINVFARAIQARIAKTTPWPHDLCRPFTDIPLRDYVHEYLFFESGAQTQHVVQDSVKQQTKSEAKNHGGGLPSSQSIGHRRHQAEPRLEHCDDRRHHWPSLHQAAFAP